MCVHNAYCKDTLEQAELGCSLCNTDCVHAFVL